MHYRDILAYRPMLTRYDTEYGYKPKDGTEFGAENSRVLHVRLPCLSSPTFADFFVSFCVHHLLHELPIRPHRLGT